MLYFNLLPLNMFLPIVNCLYLLNTPENRSIFLCFQGVTYSGIIVVKLPTLDVYGCPGYASAKDVKLEYWKEVDECENAIASLRKKDSKYKVEISVDLTSKNHCNAERAINISMSPKVNLGSVH